MIFDKKCCYRTELSLYDECAKTYIEIQEKINKLEAARKIHADNYATNNSNIMKRILAIEEKISEKYAHPDVIGSLERLEKENKSLYDSLYLTDQRSEELSCRINSKLQELSTRINELNVMYQSILNELPVYPKKPHKCPVCDGIGMVKSYMGIKDISGCAGFECNACEGKGIVWG